MQKINVITDNVMYGIFKSTLSKLVQSTVFLSFFCSPVNKALLQKEIVKSIPFLNKNYQILQILYSQQLFYRALIYTNYNNAWSIDKEMTKISINLIVN